MSKLAARAGAGPQGAGDDRAIAAPLTPYAGRRADGHRRPARAHLPGARATNRQATIMVAAATVLALAGTMIKLARVRSIGREEVLSAKAAGRRIVFVSWHGYDLCNLGVYPALYGRDSRAVILAPTTWTGRVMEQVAAGLGYDVVPIGTESSSPGSARGVVKMVARIKDGCDGMIAVDGPSGPSQEVKLGAAVIAKRASAVIVPTVVAGSLEFRIRSRWDNHLLIPPFARMIVHFGPLIDTHPAEHAAPSEEEIRQRIDAALRGGDARAREILRGAASVQV